MKKTPLMYEGMEEPNVDEGTKLWFPNLVFRMKN
jgi:hypothetical protein